MMRDRGWKLYAVIALIVIAGYQLLPENDWWKTGWQVGIGWGSAAVVLIGARRLSARDRLPWLLFALGVFSNSTGIAVSLYCDLILHWTSVPSPADPLFLGLYPACALGLALMIRRRETRRDWAAVVDAATITVGFGLLAWVYVIEPTASAAAMTTAGKTVQVAYPIGDLILLAMTARMLRGGGLVGAAFWWITGSLGAFLFGDTCWVVLGSLNADVDQMPLVHRSIDMIFLIAYALFGAAALHPSMRTIDKSGTQQPKQISGVLLVLLVGTSLIAPVILLTQARGGGTVHNGTAIAVGSATLFLLVVTRMTQLLRQVEQQATLVRELSRRDELTGLPNRRAWNDELPRALENARRDGVRVSVALLDLDHFKQFNDSYGHPAGDRLLKEATAAWSNTLRLGDTLARWGGEEFIVLLPRADAPASTTVLERTLGATPLGQTFSAGVATWDGEENSDDLISRADAALYAAKAAGRNRIQTATPALAAADPS
jgi:diguanylate cyclase (GGDEF)-like protein